MRVARLLVTVLFLFIGTAVLAGPAGAAPEPAVPYRYDNCFDFGADTEYCVKGHGVLKRESSASGNQLYKFSGHYDAQYKVNGEVVAEYSSKYNIVAVDNGAGVYHANGQSEFTYPGATCTYKYNITYANGEVRHSVYDFDCTP